MRDAETKSVPQLAAVLPESQREINAQLYYIHAGDVDETAEPRQSRERRTRRRL